MNVFIFAETNQKSVEKDMRFANPSHAKKYIHDYIVPEIEEFLREDSEFVVEKREELSMMVKEIARDGHGEMLHEAMLPYIERYFYARDGVFDWGYRLKRFLLEDILVADAGFGAWASGQDMLQAADEWGEALMESSGDAWHFLWMMECMITTGYETDWKALVKGACDRLLKEEVYGNYKRGELFAMLYGTAMIYSTSELSDERKGDTLELLKNHWEFLKNIYSVMFRCVIGYRFTNMAQVANTVTLSKKNYPYLHLFYCALKGRIDDFCVKKGDREKLEKQLRRIENLMKSTSPSAELDGLYGILFPDEFQHYLNAHRPKDYKQLESEFESFKKEMDERVAQMNSQILGMAEQLRIMASASVPISVIADELLELSPGIAWEVFVQLNGMLIENEAWVRHAGEIRRRIRNKQENPQPSVQATNYYAQGATHNDASRHISLTNDNKQITQA